MINARVEELIQLCDTDIDINGVYNHNQTQLLKRIYAYTKSRYMECSDETAIFYNISTDRSHHFAKNIDLDTKDLQPYGIGETNYYQAWILKMKFTQWMDDEHFAIKLNDLAEKVSNNGSHIIKLVKKNGRMDWDNVDLSKIFFDPTVEYIRGTDKVEEHTLTEQQIRDKEDVWKNTDKLLATEKDSEGKRTIYEYWGYEDGQYKQVIYFSQSEDNTETRLFEADMKEDDDPYYDFHLSVYEDVWLRVGVVQRLFILQEQMNRLVNYNEKNNEIGTLLILRSSDSSTTGENVLTGVESGQILSSNDLQQVGITRTEFNTFMVQKQDIDRRADELCYTPQVVRGEQSPSGTPFRSVAVSSNNAKSSFRFIRERVGETLGYILKEKVMPGVVKGWNKAEVFDLAENIEDTKLFDEFYSLFLVNDFRKKKAKQGLLVEENELNAFILENLDKLNREGRKVRIPDKYFDFEWGIKLDITGENVDKAQKNGAYESILTWIQNNPMIQNNPYFRQYVEDNGITPIRMRAQEIEQAQQAQGGQPATLGNKQDKLLQAVDTNN